MITKKFLFRIIILSSIFAFYGCTVVNNSDPNEGNIVVRNESKNPFLYITDIYVKERSDSGWHSEYHDGKLKDKDSEFITLKPGCYSIKIYTNEYDQWGSLLFQKSYEIYNPNKSLEKGDFIYAIFDGEGIYFED